MKMTVKEYAALKGISESTVKNRIRTGQIDAVQESGKYTIIAKDARRIISPEERALRKEIKLLKQENKLLHQLREERDELAAEVKTLRDKVETLHERIHDLNGDNQKLYRDVYGELKALRLTAAPNSEIIEEN